MARRGNVGARRISRQFARFSAFAVLCCRGRASPVSEAVYRPGAPLPQSDIVVLPRHDSPGILDVRTTRFGLPSLVALDAVEWLESDSEEPGSFSWCARWLSQDPQRVRAEGLPDPHGQGRLGGLPAVQEVWENAAVRFRLYGVEKHPSTGGGRPRTRRSAKESSVLRP
jgi:hypothetical protein